MTARFSHHLRPLCRLFSLLLLTIAGGLWFASCQSAGDRLQWTVDTDSLTIEIDSMGVALTMRVDYPVNDTVMAAAVARYVGEQMFFSDDEEGDTPCPVYTGDLPSYLHACARQKWQELWQMTFQPDGQADEEPDGDGLSPMELARQAQEEGSELTAYLMEMRHTYENDTVATWETHYDFFVYLTAHPSFGQTGVSLRKSDGRPIGHDVLRDTDSPEFQSLMRESLRQWSADVLDMPIDTDEELQSLLFGDDKDLNHLPMPEQCPFFAPDGVALPYYENELTFAREPTVLVLPYERVKAFLMSN